MATPSSRPPWANEMDQVDMDPGLDADMAADVQTAMQAYEGRLAPNRKFAPGTFDPAKSVVWRPDEEVAPASVSTPVTDPMQVGTQTPGQTGTAAAGAEDKPTGGAIPADADPSIPTTNPENPPPPAGAMVDVDSIYKVKLANGSDFDMNQSQAQYLLELHNWVDSQSPEIKTAWGQIETGESVAVPQSDYQAYQAWKTEQAKPKPIEAPTRPAGYDPSLVDDATGQYIAKLEANAATAAQPPVSAAPTTEPTLSPAMSQTQMDAQVAARAAQINETNTALEAATAAIKAEYGLNDTQVAHLQAVTPRLNIIPTIAQQKRQYSPTGQLLRDANLNEVFTEAFGQAMLLDPTLRTVRDNHVLQSQLARTNPAIAAAATKKANAGSLATAPSAAVPGREMDMSKMSKQDREAFARQQMIHEVGEAMSGR